jgi:hypothetical protein
MFRNERGSGRFGEERANPLGQNAQAVHLGDDRVNADFFGSRVVHGVKKNRNFRGKQLEFRSGAKAAHARHGKIEDYQIGLAFLHANNSQSSIGRLLKRFGAGVAGEKFPQNATNDVAVVHNENGFGHGKIGEVEIVLREGVEKEYSDAFMVPWA